MTSENDLIEALFGDYGPKKPVEAGLGSKVLFVRKKAKENNGFSNVSDSQHADVSTHEEIDELIVTNIGTLLEAYSGVLRADSKLDGYNLRLSIDSNGISKMFTSSGREYRLECFPELHESLEKLASFGPQVYIGEIHGVPIADEHFTNRDQFDSIRRRSNMSKSIEIDSSWLADLVSSNPLQLSLYDAYLADGNVLLDSDLNSRRAVIEELISKNNLPGIGIANSSEFTDAAEIFDKFNKETESMEGLVLKNPHASVKYTLSNGILRLQRNWDFVKYKRDLELDLVVLGYYQTDKTLDKGLMFSNLLCGVLNEETGKIETLVKTLGAGSVNNPAYVEVAAVLEEKQSRNMIRQGYAMEGTKKIADPDNQVVYSSNLKGNKIPSYIIKNPLEDSFVVRIHAMEITTSQSGAHSCGNTYTSSNGKTEIYSLRHAVLLGVHEDKVNDPRQAETTQKIRRLV